MKYMMFVVVDPDAAAEAEPSQDDLTIEQWLAEVDDRGKRVTGDALRPASEAVTVRVSRGQVLVTDGPFCETKEWIAGFDILDCENLDEAIAIAARHPQANGASWNFAGSGRTSAEWHLRYRSANPESDVL